MNRLYSYDFYSAYAQDSFRSAREIIPIVKEYLDPRSVVDVGCGLGTWLKVWTDLGVNTVMGIDGDYVQRNTLMIPKHNFNPMDLCQPTPLNCQFDLVQSLEVAEHLPERVAEGFISFLCSLGPVVLFSAAIPYQQGTNHVNEQWPEYWAQLFLEREYVAVDPIRSRVWSNPKVEYYYAQNVLLFVRRDYFNGSEKLNGLSVWPESGALARVHPRKWHEKNERALSLEQLAKMVPASTFQFIQRALRKAGRTLQVAPHKS